MSSVSFQEFFLLIVIGLIVLGPKRLPQVANQIGSWLGQARRMTRMMKRQLEDEINVDLDNLDITKQLGLDGDPKKASVSSPTYVQDRPKVHTSSASGGGRPGERVFDESESEADGATADAGDEPAMADAGQELPDDYSPAHAADEPGTGVGDDEREEQAPVALAEVDNDPEDSVAAEASVDKKKAG